MNAAKVIVVLMAVLAGATNRLHGEATPTYQAIAATTRSWIARGETWVFQDLAIIIISEPASVIRPIWINPYTLPMDAASTDALKKSTFIVIVQKTGDPICGINTLTGERVYNSYPRDQDSSTQLIACSKIADTIHDSRLTEPVREEIREFLKVHDASDAGSAP